MRRTFKLSCLSLAASLFASLALILTGCASTSTPPSEPDRASASEDRLPISVSAKTQPAIDGTRNAVLVVSPTSEKGSKSVSDVSANANTISRRTPQALPFASITRGANPSSTLVIDSVRPPGSVADSDIRSRSGYVLTPDQGSQETGAFTAEPNTGYSEGISAASDPEKTPPRTDTVEGQPYTWRDGDRVLTVLLQPDLEVGHDGEIAVRDRPQGDTVTRGTEGNIKKWSKSSKQDSESGDSSNQDMGQPVFQSDSGELMTLPGGVLLALDPEWTQTETDAFFAGNGIKLDRVSGLDFLANGFFVGTEPGFASLNLANALAGQEGVVLSSPNWKTEVSTD